MWLVVAHLRLDLRDGVFVIVGRHEVDVLLGGLVERSVGAWPDREGASPLTHRVQVAEKHATQTVSAPRKAPVVGCGQGRAREG